MLTDEIHCCDNLLSNQPVSSDNICEKCKRTSQPAIKRGKFLSEDRTVVESLLQPSTYLSNYFGSINI